MVWSGKFGSGTVSDFIDSLFAPSINNVLTAVRNSLANSYQLAVENYNIQNNWNDTGTVTLNLRTDQDRGDGETDDGLTDIQGNVDNAFAAAGLPVLASGITSYSAATSDGKTGNPQATGVATPTAPPDGNTKPGGPSWLDSLLGKVEAGSVGVVIGGAIVIGLLIYLSVRKAAPV
jgi:hypothetical protein